MSGRQRTRARLIAGLTALGGLLSLASTLPIVGRPFDRLIPVVVPFGVRATSYVGSVLAGVSLLLLAGQLARRKHMAWMVSICVFVLSVAFLVLRNRHVAPMAFSVVMVVLLVLGRHDFEAPGDPPTLFAFVRFVPRYLAGVFVYGMVVSWAMRDHVVPGHSLGRDFVATAAGLVGVEGPYRYTNGFLATVFPASMLALGIFGALVAIVLAFRPIVARHGQHPSERDRASRLVHAYGADTLDYFSLRDDKMYFFSSDGEAMIAYTYAGRYALVSGDPVGAEGSIEVVVDEFMEFCRRRAWGIAFLAVRESDRERYIERGLHTFYLGDEAVVDCRGFSLEGKKWKSIRQSANRVERTFSFVAMAESEADPVLVEKLNAISAKWRGKAPERGFTMTLRQDVTGENSELILCMALDENGEPGGFLRIVPVFGDRSGYTLDLMRRDPDTPNGMTEFLLTRTMMHLDTMGIARLSMNFAAWGRLFSEDMDFTVSQRVAKRFLELVNPFFQIRSLKEFNQRFYPQWVPRVVVYDDIRALPRVALLFGAVEGLVNLPVIGRYLLPAPDR